MGLPARPNQVVGRDTLIADLVGRLTAGPSARLALEGAPGIGKTTLALLLAHQPALLSHFKDGVLWTSLGPQPNAMQSLAVWAEALGQDVSALTSEAARGQAVKTAIGNRHLLLVLDDAWRFKDVEFLTCGGPYCGHLLTTRDKELAVQFAGTAQIESVPVLDDDAARALWQDLAPEACAADPQAIETLLNSAGGLPLTLKLLGSYLAVPRRRLTASLTQKALVQLLDPKSRLQLVQKRLGAQQQLSLLETIDLSLAGLLELAEGQSAVQAFYALGAFAPKPERFSWAAAQAVSQVDEDSLALLWERNLLEADEHGLALHQTLAEVARTKLDEGAVARQREYYLSLVKPDPNAWQQIEPIYGQLKWAWTAAADNEDLLAFLSLVQHFHIRRGLWRDELDWTERALRLAETRSWPSAVGGLLQKIGAIYNRLDRGELALTYLQRALAVFETAKQPAAQTDCLILMGLLYRRLGQARAAIEALQRALVLSEQVDHRPGKSDSLIALGDLYRRLGQPDRALAFLQQALPFQQEAGNKAGQADTLSAIGMVYKDTGKFEQALDCFQQVLAIWEELDHRSGQADVRDGLAQVFAQLGQFQEAAQVLHQALPIWQDLGDRHAQAWTLSRLGESYYQLGQPEQALAYYRQCLAIREEIGPQREQAITLENIAWLYSKVLGQPEEAIEAHRQALAVWQALGGQNEQAEVANHLGHLYSELGRWQEALAAYEQARSLWQALADQTGQARALNNLGLVYAERGQAERALALLRQALTLVETAGDEVNERIFRFNLGLHHLGQNELQEAYRHLRRVVQLDKSMNHPDLEHHQTMLAQVQQALKGESCA